MNIWQELLANQALISSVIAWLVAQVLKTFIDFAMNGSLSPERMVGSGGMPSSHSSTVCALVVSTAICYGVSGFEFGVSFVLASVVMYDAIGVRRETGKQAKLLNLIMQQDFFKTKLNGHEFQETLKEFVGHTPLQVLAGAVLGIGIAFMVDLFYH